MCLGQDLIVHTPRTGDVKITGLSAWRGQVAVVRRLS
jgi:hypothetical protein